MRRLCTDGIFAAEFLAAVERLESMDVGSALLKRGMPRLVNAPPCWNLRSLVVCLVEGGELTRSVLGAASART